MNWISNVVPPKVRLRSCGARRPKTFGSNARRAANSFFTRISKRIFFVVPGSGYHMRIAPKARLDNLFDDGRV